MKFILAFLIFSLTFVRESAALESGDDATPLFVRAFDISSQDTVPRGLTFNDDGSKMYTTGTAGKEINQYKLTTNFDVSTASFEKRFSTSSTEGTPMSLKFNNDGTKMFIVGTNGDEVNEYILSTAFDISTASHESIFSLHPGYDSVPWGIDFNTDGTKMFITGNQGDDINEFSLNVAFDLSEGVQFIQKKYLRYIALERDEDAEDEPFGIHFSEDGTRMFLVGTKGNDINQYSLSIPYDISTLFFEGGLRLDNEEVNPSGVAFSNSGLRMFIVGTHGDEVNEYHLSCPYNLFKGKCPAITIGDRTGIAESQIEGARRIKESSTDNALNRLKWIRRNKDMQNLSHQNIKLNFSNEMLASLAEVINISTKSKKKNKDQDVFYWSEGSIGFGKKRKTSVASVKNFKTNEVTFGVDKFNKDNGIDGLAFRIGKNDVKVGHVGSKLETDSYNLTYYSTSPLKDDNRYLDSVIGMGVLKSDILSILDGERINGNRNGKQVYGTIKLKDEIKKGDLILIPSGQIDLGYTVLNGYSESGKTGMKFEKQSIQSRAARLSIASFEEINHEKYKMKRHAKLEYKANLFPSSNIKYSYISDSTNAKYDTELTSEAIHNINGEIGVDIIFSDYFSIFFIYEHNDALGVGYTNKIHLAIGYLPNKNTNYAFSINGSENLMSQFIMKKNINGYDLTFNLNDDLTNLGNNKEASINLNKVF